MSDLAQSRINLMAAGYLTMPAAAKIREECAAEAADREARFREAKRHSTAHPLDTVSPANQPSRPMARRPQPTPVTVPVAALSQPSDDDAAMAEFTACLATVQARRERGGAVTPERKTDWARLAIAMRENITPAPPKKLPTKRALFDGQCPRCAIRTRIRCDHLLPYLGDDQ